MTLGFIGSGKMASALVRGIVKTGAVSGEAIVVTDSNPAAAADLAARAGVGSVPTNVELVACADAIVICVKPGDAVDLLKSLDLGGKLVISIVAGISLGVLEAAAGPSARLVRVMPNTPALIHRGAAGYALGKKATPDDALLTEKLFGAVGTIIRVKEDLLDVVTGLSGSGPAYVCLLVEALADGGVLMGLPRDLALRLAAQTVAGSAEMILQTGEHPAVLRDIVASPGGTTIAGIEALEIGGVRSGMIAAVRAATERARELGGAK
jgi:pyrroline-5-carboxylate reductase